ncbi:MAG: tol-pal system protein YbgF [Micavibrio aeruginosavorus]|nr:tol-pal system protein YbgF [Micavibrio aeruginosavorus]
MAIVALLVFAPVVPALAQSSDTAARIERLENEIQTLSRAIFKGETPPPGAFSSGNEAAQANLQNRLDQIETDMRSITGRIEELGYDINRLKEMEGRIAALENRAVQQGAVPSATPSASSGMGMAAYQVTPPQLQMQPQGGGAMDNYGMTDPNAPAPAHSPTAGQLGAIETTIDSSGVATATPGTPMGDYEAAYAMLRNQDYASAEIAFDKFIKDNPDNTLVPNALYWLGETYYVRNDFEKAARTFAEAYRKYPKGAKAPDNLLKLAMSLAGLGKTQDACVALGQLKKEYPAGSAPVLTRADQEIARLGCK